MRETRAPRDAVIGAAGGGFGVDLAQRIGVRGAGAAEGPNALVVPVLRFGGIPAADDDEIRFLQQIDVEHRSEAGFRKRSATMSGPGETVVAERILVLEGIGEGRIRRHAAPFIDPGRGHRIRAMRAVVAATAFGVGARVAEIH